MRTAGSPPSQRTSSIRPAGEQPLPSIRAEVERIERISVCTRPFRAQGPRIEPERLGGKLVVHNYGHGGAGWSLSWGSAARVVSSALADGVRDVAVLGCGALGLTAALSLQRAGARVTLHAREIPPEVRSSRATGLWSPDSRVALAADMAAAAAARWETMARSSWETFQQSLELPGRPIEFHSRFLLSELPPDEDIAERYREDPVGFAHLDARLGDLYAPPVDRGPAEHAFAMPYSRELRMLRFNITEYSQHLLREFRERGGTLRRTEFHTPGDLALLTEEVIVNCTGYGARALLGDESLIPVRGQIGWLPAQPELGYSLQCGRLSVVPRGDGIAVQIGASSDGTGWKDANELPDRTEAESAVRRLGALQMEACGTD